ncbi:MAG: hypothetical protein P4L61_01020, partial [Candidatus Pacebacteria bacterium]|nr:hypothetical protein [Candidatus Paceibacterota bacterium]
MPPELPDSGKSVVASPFLKMRKNTSPAPVGQFFLPTALMCTFEFSDRNRLSDRREEAERAKLLQSI